jgi:NAD(P)-dependent dehydrogenase (short-subunit alcohol dehydrogenase family)
MTMSHLPPYYAYSFTPTTHTSVPSSLSPSLTPLPHPSIVVITGAGKGLGYQIALSYALAGCSGLSISSRTMGDLDALETEILKISAASKNNRRSGIEVLKTVCDVTSDSSVQHLQDEVVKKWGRVDVVIANAGVISNYIPRKDEKASNLPVGIVEDGDWARVLETNINGVWRISTFCSSLTYFTTMFVATVKTKLVCIVGY